MLNKIKTTIKHPWITQFKDVRAIGLLVFGVVVLLISWSGVKVIQSNFELQKKISTLSQENAVRQLANDNLELRNQYLKTDQFLELAARRQFGKGAPGETLITIPKAVALKHTVEPAAPSAKAKAEPDHKPTYQKNFEAWMNFFLNRDQQVES
jgi:cell division protein FtsB